MTLHCFVVIIIVGFVVRAIVLPSHAPCPSLCDNDDSVSLFLLVLLLLPCFPRFMLLGTALNITASSSQQQRAQAHTEQIKNYLSEH